MGEQNELQILNKTSSAGTCNKGKQGTQHVGEHTSTSEWTKLLALTTCLSTLGTSIPAGYCIGVMNNPAAFIRQWCNETIVNRYGHQLSEGGIDILWSSIVSILLVGGAVGSLTGAILANKYGRKNCVIISGVLLILGSICFYLSRIAALVELLVCGRFIVGLGSGIVTSSLPMYLSEIAPLALRGTLAVLTPVGLSAGVLVGQIFSLSSIFGSDAQWHVALSIYVVLIVTCLAPAMLFPESPKYLLVVKGDRDEAKLQLIRLRGKLYDFTKEIEAMDIEARRGEEAMGFWDVIKDSKLLLPLFIVCFYQFGSQLSGINAIFYYSVSIFRRAGMSAEASEWATLGAGCLNLAASLLGPLLMARINRRTLMLLSTSFCSLFLLGFALMLNLIESVSWFANGCIACIFLFIFFFQFGIGPIPFFIGSELFEVAPRSVAMSLGSLSSWSGNFIIGMTFPTLQNAWGSFSFLPFSASCAIMFLLTKFYLPETRGRDPSEIAPIISKGFRSKVV